MRGFSLRFASAAAVTAASAVAFMAPGTASAACTGANIEGSGSSLQALAQKEVWVPHFNAKCAGTEQVGYRSIGSGAGLKSWGVGKVEHNFGAEFAFVGTDQPPNPTQKSEIEFYSASKVLSIPTLQAAITIPMHLPTGCTSAVSAYKKIKGKLVLNQETVEAIFSRKITKWSQIKDDGDELLPKGCEGTTEITRVVREDGSGTTATFKKWLYEINRTPVDPENGKNWNELAEQNKNLEWPEEKVSLIRGNGNPGVVSGVAATAGSIGYANLADTRKSGKFTPEGGGGENTPLFWAAVQNLPGKAKYTDPSTDGEVNAKANSNCEKTKYIDVSAEGKAAKFPPASTEAAWNEVSASLKEAKYPICGFTYDLSLVKFSTTASEKAAATAAEEETISNYFSYVLGAGQTDLAGNDYLGLPNTGSAKSNVTLIAKAGAAKISY